MFTCLFMLSCADDSWKQELEDIKAELANQKQLIEALQQNSTITGIEQGNGQYTIKFSNGQAITLTNGKTPIITIGENGNWFIDGVDTGKPSKGEDGADGADGSNGTNGEDGTDGTDGKTPTIEIGANGNWIINGIDTEIKAEGQDGKNAPYIVSIIENQSSIIFIFSDNTSITCSKPSYDYTIKKYKLPTTNYMLAQYDNNGGLTESTLNGSEYPAILDRISGEINPIFRYDVPVQQAASNYPVYDAVKQSSLRALGYSIDFMADCQYLEFKGYPSYKIVVIVDNVIATNIISTEYTGGYRYVKIDLRNKKKRHIKVYITGLFMGVKTENGGTIEKYTESKLFALFDGDSIVEGTGSTFTPAFGWPSIATQILNWDCLNCGVGASGYIKKGNQGEPSMPDRFDTYIKPHNPDVFIVSAGLNDPATPDTKEAIFTYWEKVKRELPNTIIIAVSPFSPEQYPNESVQQITEWCREAALENKLPYIDIVNGKTYDELGNLITDNSNGAVHGIISGTGNAGSSVDPNDGNRFEYICSDNTHPTKEGHQYIGERVAQEIYKLLR